MQLDLPLYAAARLTSGRWLVRAPNADPFLPAVHTVAVLEDEPMTIKPAHFNHPRSALRTSRVPQTRAEIGDINWRDDLLQIARLVDRLSPDRDDPEAFFMKKNALAHELRRLAHWSRHVR
jgi:hypothetical protein